MSAVFVVLPSLIRAMVQVLALFLPCPQTSPGPWSAHLLSPTKQHSALGEKPNQGADVVLELRDISIRSPWMERIPSVSRGGGLLRCNLFFFSLPLLVMILHEFQLHRTRILDTQIVPQNPLSKPSKIEFPNSLKSRI